MNFASDNTSGIAPEILEAIGRANRGSAAAYGEDSITENLERHFAEIFETEVGVFPVATGTAANALALALLTPPWGAILCHEAAHIFTNEANAPEFYTDGAKLHPLPGAFGKLTAGTVAASLPGGLGSVHYPQPATISITQASEAGTVYRPDEIGAIAEAGRRYDLSLHMDGARFANAVAFLAGATPADLTWRAGVDVLTFGATKNGAMAAEAVILFGTKAKARAGELGFRRKRAGHLWSKLRYLSVQLEAYLADGLWLRNAYRANRAAQRLAAGLTQISGMTLRYPVEANEVFVEMPEATVSLLEESGFGFHRWDDAERPCVRLVTAFDSADADIDALISIARQQQRT
jgi:threonine aldolase